MSIFPDFSKRIADVEIMDDLQLEGTLLEKTLDQLAWINSWLGGNMITWEGIRKVSKQLSQEEIVVGDLGTGGGDSLRYIAKKTKKLKAKFQFIGYDANEATLAYATKLSRKNPNIRFQKVNILDPAARFEKIDMVTAALFLHHLPKEEIISLIQKCKKQGVKFFIINDLQRHSVAYFLFYCLSKILGFTHMAQHDGLISIRKAFSKQDLVQILTESGIKSYQIKWRWAFRYLAIANLTK